MTLNGVMAVALRYFTDFGKLAFQHITASICGGNLCTSILYSVVCVYDVVRKEVHDRYLIS